MGPVELWIDGRRRDLGTAKERRVLAALLLSPRRAVPAESLVRRVWDDDPPPKARQSLYSYITRLRHRLEGLEGVALASRQGNYALEVEDEAVDLHRFRLLRDQARAIAGSGDDEYALEHYREAAALWRGPPLADLSGDWVDRTRKGLEEELLAAAFERLDIELRRGNHADAVGELADLADRYPFDERAVERLMVALFRSGRQAEALETYRRTRGLLADELGTDLGHGLQDLHQRILRNDPDLLRPPGARLAADDGPPNNLPYDVHAFTGRAEELREALRAVPSPAGEGGPPRSGSAATVITVDGMPGVGKTAFAVRLAHLLSGRFADGQIFVSLRASDAGREPLDPASALDTLLRVAGVPAARIPRGADERAALWRSRLAGGNAILVLDDAAGHDQVRPLLPAAAGCLVIVTSRRRLAGLHDAHPLSLEVLPPDDAAELFTSVAGSDRALAPSDVAAVVERCGFLPLAVRIAASRLRHRRSWSVADLLGRLTPDDRRLEELRVEGSEITGVFEASYRALPSHLRRAFRLLGLHPGPHVGAHAAAAVLGVPVRESERILDELLDRHLIAEPERGRYRFHDLVREYARRLAHEEDGPGERREAGHRLLDYYLAAADRADRTLVPHRRRIAVRISHRPRDLPPLATEKHAQQWLADEHECLLNAVRYAAGHGWAGHVARFAHVLAKHLEARGHWDMSARLQEQAIAVWDDAGDPRGTAQALSDLSHIRFRGGEYASAMESAEEALSIYRSLAEDGPAGTRALEARRAEADLLDHQSLILWHRSWFAEALARSRRSLELRRALGDRHGEALSLDHSAIFLEYLGRYEEAAELRNEALLIFEELNDPRGRTMVLNNSGDLALRLGRVDEALRYYERTAEAAAELGRQHEAIWLINMANVDQIHGRADEALQRYRKALAIISALGDRRTEAEVLVGIGTVFARGGRFGEAIIHYQKALDLARTIAELYEETLALRKLGEAHAGSGRHAVALDHFRQAHELAVRTGVPYETAKALDGMGSALLHLRGRAAARARWRESLAIFERLGGLPEADHVRSRLLGADPAAGA